MFFSALLKTVEILGPGNLLLQLEDFRDTARKSISNELCLLLRIVVPTQRSRKGKVQLGPNILKAHVMELFSSRQGSMAEKGC